MNVQNCLQRSEGPRIYLIFGPACLLGSSYCSKQHYPSLFLIAPSVCFLCACFGEYSAKNSLGYPLSHYHLLFQSSENPRYILTSSQGISNSTRHRKTERLYHQQIFMKDRDLKERKLSLRENLRCKKKYKNRKTCK